MTGRPPDPVDPGPDDDQPPVLANQWQQDEGGAPPGENLVDGVLEPVTDPHPAGSGKADPWADAEAAPRSVRQRRHR